MCVKENIQKREARERKKFIDLLKIALMMVHVRLLHTRKKNCDAKIF